MKGTNSKILRDVVAVIACFVAVVFCSARLVKADGLRTLVVVDSDAYQKTHSKYFAALKEDGHTLTIKQHNADGLELTKFGESLFDNIVLFAPSMEDFKKAKRGRLGVQDLVEFVDNGGNVLTAVGKTIGEGVRKFANEMGVDFDDAGSSVVDHFAFTSKIPGNDRTLIEVKDVINAPSVVSPPSTSLLYRGVSHLLNPSNTMTYPLLRANPTSYSAAWSATPLPLWDGPIQAGGEVLLVSAMQAANSARAVFAGSLDMFSDEFINANPANLKFCRQLTAWTFKQRGVLRASNLKHHKVHEDEAPYMYRIKDDITFSVDIHEKLDGKWVPYNANDVQLEYIMLDPYVRLFLNAPTGKNNATFSLTFKSPDQYGIFKFHIDYLRQGYTHLFLEELAPLRNFKHSDYDRFLWCASPYYGAAFSTLAGLLLFSTVFLYHKPAPTTDARKLLPKNVY